VFTGMCTRRSIDRGSVTQGHRGNHVARTRATARRTVMKESRKCRSGRVAVRTVVTMRRFPRGSFSGRGGKSPGALATINASKTSTMDTWLVPAAEGAALVVIQPKLSLGVLVHPFGAPPLLDSPNELAP